MSTYIVRQAFLTFTVGQVVYSDADAAGRPAASVIQDAQVAGHSAALVAVSSTTGGTSTGGTSTTGTTTTPTTGTTTTSGPVVTSFVRNADGSTTFTSSDGTMLTVAASASLTAAQAQQLAATSNIVNSAGQVTAPVVGDVANATVNGVTEGAIKTEADASKAADVSQSASISNLTGSVSALGSQVGTLQAQVSGFSSQSGAAVATSGTPLMDGAASLGSATTAARSDHVHASDTSRAAASALTSLAGTVANQGTSLASLSSTVGTNATAISTQGSLLASTRSVALVTPSYNNGTLAFGHADGSAGVSLPLSVGGTAASSLINAVSSDFLVTSGTLGLAQDVLGFGSGSTGAATAGSTSLSSPAYGTYFVDSFAGAQLNTTGQFNSYDDAAASAMWSKILADAKSCTNVAAGFTAKIVFGAHQYNWQSPVNFIVPGNGSTQNPGSSLPVELHLVVEWNSSVHYTFGSAGFCFSPYTVDGRYDDLFSRKQLNNRYQGVSAYAIKKTATAGVGAAAFAALPSSETAGGGVSNFRFGQMDVYDANTGGHYLSWLDVSGVFFAQVDGPAGTSNPGGAVSATHGVNFDGVSAIRLGGFNIQFWFKNLLPNYVECCLRIVGYVEALLSQNIGGVNCDYNVWCDAANTDWTMFYPNSYSFGLQWTFDDQSEMDAYRWNFDISTVNIILFYGGTVYQHAVGNNAACDGQITGDTANTGGIILRGCTAIKVHDIHFTGPAINPGYPGQTCANGGRGLTITSCTFNGLQNKPSGPPNGTYQRSTHGTADGNDFAGFGASGTVSPILFDSDCIALTSFGNRFYFAPSNLKDGYCARYPVEDRYGSNQGWDFVGASDGSFNTSTRSLR